MGGPRKNARPAPYLPFCRPSPHGETLMSKVLVLYYSTYGHLETMAQAVAEGARSTGATVDVKRVPETVPPDIAKNAHFKLDQAAPVATVAELEHYDAIIVGAPTPLRPLPPPTGRFFRPARRRPGPPPAPAGGDRDPPPPPPPAPPPPPRPLPRGVPLFPGRGGEGGWG